MAETISVKEAAERWGLSERSVRGMCSNGKIPGVIKSGRDWKIPANTEKPEDKRFRQGKYAKSKAIPKPLPLP
ncbi:MAG TPA: helix-turn-helix domain-containing protein, partial [Methanocorpusculum sp.]|nr:helix-turn-helix domain-containing protein [Methanocorpusculum sp.]